ncbi:MAG: glycosyltransferase [Bacteroidetes bacterium]|nr:glycosyltransferase [Bacteroidota bacterium]
MNPKISIVTVVYNSKDLIEHTIISVLEQSFQDFEFIVVDGASKDGTLEVINKYKHKISKIISEKDKGIYDAMNKGLNLASGDYILYLNSGDEFFDRTTLEKVLTSTNDADIVYGKTSVIGNDRGIIGDARLKPPHKLSWKSLQYGMCVCHQSFIPKRSLCKPYDLSFKISSDIDWVISILKEAKVVQYYDGYISKFLVGGTSTKNKYKSWRERFKILSKHYGVFKTAINHIYIASRYFFLRNDFQ